MNRTVRTYQTITTDNACVVIADHPNRMPSSKLGRHRIIASVSRNDTRQIAASILRDMFPKDDTTGMLTAFEAEFIDTGRIHDSHILAWKTRIDSGQTSIFDKG